MSEFPHCGSKFLIAERARLFIELMIGSDWIICHENQVGFQ